MFWKKKDIEETFEEIVEKKLEALDINKTEFILVEQKIGGFKLTAKINIDIFDEIDYGAIICKKPKSWSDYRILPEDLFYVDVKNEKEALKAKELFLKGFKLRKAMVKKL